MTGDTYLLAIAAIGITLGGFIGVIKTFQVARGKWKSQERSGMRVIFDHSFGAVFFGTFPFLIFYTFGQGRLVWLVSSTLLACFLLFEYVYHAVNVACLTKEGNPPSCPLPLLIHFFPFTLAALILQIVNLFHWQEAWPYFWGIFWLLQPPAFQYYLFIHFMQMNTGEEDSTRKGKST